MDKYLPIGSVVALKEDGKRVMIYGRLQKNAETGGSFDYVACPYPEGNLGHEHTFLFNHELIHQVHFLGFQDPEEIAFQHKLDEVAARIGSGGLA